MPKYLKHAERVGRPVRWNDHGVNCGYWTSETGRLNQVWHLWRYDSYAHREDLRTQLSQNRDWNDGYVNVITEWVLNQDICIMNPHSDFPPLVTKVIFMNIVSTVSRLGQRANGLVSLSRHSFERVLFTFSHHCWKHGSVSLGGQKQRQLELLQQPYFYPRS